MGFLATIQSTKIDVNFGYVQPSCVLTALLKKDRFFAIDAMIRLVEKSGSYRGAEQNFERVRAHLPAATDAQIERLLRVSAANDQVHHAGLCARDYLPSLISSHGHLLYVATRDKLQAAIEPYASSKSKS